MKRFMTKLGKALLGLSLALGSQTVLPTAHAAVVWESVGSFGFGAGTHNSLSLDNDGVPYVVYAASSAIFMKKYVSGSWQDVSTTATFAMRANDMVRLYFDHDNMPYMAFNNTGAGNKVEIDQLVSGEWKRVGNEGLSVANGYYQNLVFDSENQPYTAFTDFGQSTKTIVMTPVSGTWTNVGTLPWNNSTTSPSLAIASDDTLYVAFVDASDSNQVKVYQYSGGIWSMVGSSVGTGVNSNYTLKLKISSDDVPYVDFIDGAKSGKLTVKRYVNGSWETIGSAGFSPAADTFMGFDLDSSDVPYVAFGANSYKANVMRYVDGAWEYVGGADFLNDVNRITVAVNPDDNVYFHYKSTTSTNLGLYLAKLPLSSVKAVPGNGQAVLSFKHPTGATSVVVEQSSDGGGSWTTAATEALDGNSTGATVTGLTNGTSYEFRVNVTGGAKPGISNVATATPIAPLSDVAGMPGDGQATLTFTAPAGATSVIVEKSTDGGTTWTTATTSVALTASSTGATVTGLTNGTAYKLRVNVSGGSFPGISNVVDVTPPGTIFDLAATRGDGTVSLSFTAPIGASSVVAEQSDNGGTSWTTATTEALGAGSTSAIVTGLTNGTTYGFRLNVSGGMYQGLSNVVSAMPAAPLADVAATAGNTEAVLTFSAPTGATAVVVEQSTDGGATWNAATTDALNADSTGATITGLTNGTTYRFRVSVTGGAHEGLSNVADALPCLPIADLAATAGPGQAALTFSAASGATTVAVEQSTDGGTSWTTATTTVALSASSTGATVTGLMNGTSYKLRLSVTGGVNNGLSNEASVTPVAPITDLAATANDSQVQLTFTAAAGASSVIAEQSTDGGTSWTTATTDALTASSTSATVTGLTNGTTYKFRISVIGGANEGLSNIVDAKPTLAIGDLTATGGDSQAVLTFSAPTGATAVVVEQSTDGGTTWTAATTDALDADSTGATVTGLTNGTTYHFRVIVTGGAKEGESNVVSALPSIPLNDLTAVAGDASATLQFGAAIGATSVIVEKSADGGTTWTPATTSAALDADSTAAQVTGLVNGTAYLFRLKVAGGVHNGHSNAASATPIGTLGNLAAVPADASVNLNFGQATRAAAVVVEQSADGGTTWTQATTSDSLNASSTSATVTGLINGTAYQFRLHITGGAYDGLSNVVSSTPVARPRIPTKEIVPIVVDGGNNDSQLVNLTIERTTNPDGTKKDTVVYQADKAADSIGKAKELGRMKIRLVIPDSKDEVSELNVELPKATVEEIASGKVDFEIYTDNARIIVPQSSVSGLTDSLYFRLIPLKKEEERKAVEERAKKEEIVKQTNGEHAVQVVARPMTIETNLSSRSADVILPLRDVAIPSDPKEREKYLARLIVFIEHSDGERVIAKPTIVPYKDGGLGVMFTVTKFSTFTILAVDGDLASDLEEQSHQAYIHGYADGTFRPSVSVTRAEIAAMLTRLQLGTEKEAEAIGFEDVKPGHWAEKGIRHVTASGLMNGYSHKEFAPGKAITRGELAVVIARLLSLTDAGTANAADIGGHWAEKQIRLALQAGFMTVDTEGRFRPDDSLTRAEAVTVLNRVMKRGPLQGVTVPTWSDIPVGHWALAQIEEASLTHFFTTEADGKEYLKEREQD
ncbi:S-layer homology domain-containing protein [Paenibacillus glycinis]|uniref:Uncharacterized protein n=1 Tax=Paenibacillus glycinis TaxID=2697035 RepID=A0ABW9XMA1_9BACL|nr:S-layer homology domain-containing protein [Paenibacillus glycinis]NBD23758.1 hypothetical protein [Paenibacillus glycinis]